MSKGLSISLCCALVSFWASASGPEYLLERLPLLCGPERNTAQFSSHSKHQQNGDVYNILYRDAHGDAVIFDAKGSGTVTSMWGTVLDPDALIKFYFDSEDTPRYCMGWIDLFKGVSDDFPSVFNTYDRRGYYIQESMAANSFQPIPYTNGFKIAIQGTPAFYHVLYETGNDENLDLRKESLLSILDNKQPVFDDNTKRAVLKSHGWLTLLDTKGSGCVDHIRIVVPSDSLFLTGTRIQMIWDNAPQTESQGGALAYERSRGTRFAHVNSPVGHFFVCPFKPETVQAYPVSTELLGDGTMALTCRFVMPFWQNARIVLRNDSDKDFAISYDVHVSSKVYPENSAAYFCTNYREGLTDYGNDWTFARLRGAGSLVGVVQTCQYGHYCEGNEHFYIDGSRTPQINGTGTEDYFLGCFWPNLPYHTALAGCVNDVRIEGGGDPTKWETCFASDYLNPAAYYRFHLEMPIVFHSSLDALIQQGAENMVESRYTSLAYYYLRRTPTLEQTDYIDLGNTASRKSHSYKSKGCPYTLSSSYEGDDYRTILTDSGFQHSNKEEISFSLCINRKNNGVILRRRLDQCCQAVSDANLKQQTASVFVNGKFVGDWHVPFTNDILRWADSDFFIPSDFSRGKEVLNITLRVSSLEYNDFEYICYSSIEL